MGEIGAKPSNPTVGAIKRIKRDFPNLLVAVDVCLCPYTISGHCGVLKDDGFIDNQKSLTQIVKIAKSFVVAGADVIAPSDMMDGRIKAIKDMLQNLGYLNRVCSALQYISHTYKNNLISNTSFVFVGFSYVVLGQVCVLLLRAVQRGGAFRSRIWRSQTLSTAFGKSGIGHACGKKVIMQLPSSTYNSPYFKLHFVLEMRWKERICLWLNRALPT